MKVHTLIVGGVRFALMPPDVPPKRDEPVLGLVNVHETLILDAENELHYHYDRERNHVIKILHLWQGTHWEDENNCCVACDGWMSMGVGEPEEI